MEIIRYISELLLLRESVILPGFGEFKAIPKKPGANSDGNLTPPGKSVSFNPTVKANDYVLARHIAERENIPISHGNEKLREFVGRISGELEKTGNFSFNGIGTFFLDSFNSMTFNPDPEANFDMTTYGLGKVAGMMNEEKPVISEAETSRYERPDLPPAETREEIMPEPLPLQRKRRWVWIALICILLAGAVSIGILFPDPFATAWTTISHKLGIQKDAANAESSEVPALAPQPEQSIPVEPTPETPDTIQEIAPQNTSPSSPAQKLPASPVQTGSIPSNGDFMIVAGCFGSQENADRLANKLRDKGFTQAAIEGKTPSGLFRVSAGSYSSKEDAQKALQEANARNELKNAWVGRK